MTHCHISIKIKIVAKITVEAEVSGLLTFVEAAEYLGTSRTNVYNMVERGRLNRVDIGETGFVIKGEVEMLRDKKCPTCGAEIKEGVNKQAEATATSA